MKSKMILSLMPVFLVVCVIVGERAQAIDVGVGINLGGSTRYHRSGTVVYRTVDPVYTTWYPERTTSYDYTPTYYSSSYYDGGYGYGYTTPSTYVYSTNSTRYNDWYGSGRTGRGGTYYSRDYRNNTD